MAKAAMNEIWRMMFSPTLCQPPPLPTTPNCPIWTPPPQTTLSAAPPPPHCPSLNPPPPPCTPSAHFYWGGGVAYKSKETAPPPVFSPFSLGPQEGIVQHSEFVAISIFPHHGDKWGQMSFVAL